MNNEQGSVQIQYNISDILNLIPNYTGERDEIEFIYFREGCRMAMKVVGPKNEKLLMIFLKTKLRGDAFTRFALRLSSYQNIYQFLRELKRIYASKIDEPMFWKLKMLELRQNNEPMEKVGARMQELIQCAICGVKFVEPKPIPVPNVDTKPKQNLEKNKEKPRTRENEKINDQIRRNAAAGNTKFNTNRPLSFKTIMEMINKSTGTEDPYRDEEVTLRTERGRMREKPLSIKGSDYPRIEYPASPIKDNKINPNFDLDDASLSLKSS